MPQSRVVAGPVPSGESPMSCRLARQPEVLSWGPNGLPVPYATAWSAETPTMRSLTVRVDGSGLVYRDETPADRDRNGVLWARVLHAPGEGRPHYRSLHPQRQRRAMFGMLCHVCGGPASRTSQGWLFLIQRPNTTKTVNWPEGALSTKPPICRPCLALAMRHCPHLTVPVAVRSRKPRVWGAFGGFVTATSAGELSVAADDYLPYGDPAFRWFLASQLVVELTRCGVSRPSLS